MNGDEPSREDLLRRASALGIEHPENMTRVELVRAIAQFELGPAPRSPSTRTGSWLDIARQLLAAVVEQGLNMPDAAALIRGETKLNEPPKAQPPLATVTLAKIYAAQGHVTRALSVLAEVLKAEPDHQAALDLQSQIKDRPGPEAPRRKGPPPVPSAATLDALASVAKAVSRTSSAKAAESSEPPRPLGGEENELVLLVRDGTPQGLGWELSKQTEASRVAGTAIEIEWVTFAPSWQGPIRQLTRIPVTSAFGRMALPRAAPPALVHAALHMRQGASSVPLATLKTKPS